MKLAKKIALFVAVALVVAGVAAFSGSVPKAHAASSFAVSREQYVKNLSQDQAQKDYTQGSYQLSAFSNLAGAAGVAILGAKDPITGQNLSDGAVPELGNAMAFMIKQPPASGELWLADLWQHSPLMGERVYAQGVGVGFSSLVPILPVWKAFRDLAYIAFIFIFVCVGFMIMFRKKLGGQTVASISNALPKMVVTLLLITFSYAIAGFLIDLMYIAIYFICGVFVNLTKEGLGNLVNIALTQNIFQNGLGLVWSGTGGPTTSVAGTAAYSIGNLISSYFAGDSGISLGIKTILGDVAGVLGYLIFAIAIFFAVIKTFFELLKSYVTFMIMVIFSPFQLLLGIFKENGDFSQWVRNLASTLVPFPVVITIIFLSMTLSGSGISAFQPTAAGDAIVGFQPPQIGLIAQPNGNETSSGIQGLIVIGLIMLLPEAVEMSKKWLKATSPFDDLLPKISKNLAKGWTGGEAIPGLAFTDTRKLPYGGISGENVTRKAAVGGGAVVGGALGLPDAAWKKARKPGTDFFGTWGTSFKTGASTAGKIVSDPQFGPKKKP